MPTKKHDPTVWLESDSDLSSEPSDLPNAQLSEVDAVCVKAVFERLFQRLRLLDLLKVDAGEQVRAVHRAESRGAATPPSRRRNRANPNPERARTPKRLDETSTRVPTRTRRRTSRTPPDIARSYSHPPLFPLLRASNAQAAEMSRGVGAEISRVMRKQTDLEGRFEDLISRRETLVRAANKRPYLENQARVSETAAELRSTTNELCVNLKQSPDVLENLRFAVAERAELVALVAETLESLDEEGSFSRLVRVRVKEEARDMDMEATRAREKALSGEVAALRDRIAREKAEHETWAEEKAKTVATLKAELKEKKSRAGSETRFAKKDIVADSECNARQRAQTLAALRRDHEALAAETAREKAAHAEIMAYLETREGGLSARVAELETKHVEDKERRERLLSETKARSELLAQKLPVAKAAYEEELAKKQARAAEKREAQARAEREAAGGEETRRRAAGKMQLLKGLWQSDRDAKIAAKEAAKAEAEAAKAEKGGKKKGK